MQKFVIAFAVLIFYAESALGQGQIYDAQTYTFPVHVTPVPKPPSIELEVLTPGCEKLLQYNWLTMISKSLSTDSFETQIRKAQKTTAVFSSPGFSPYPFEKQLRQVLAFRWNNSPIVDPKPETLSVTFAINSKAEFSEFKLDKSSGNKKIDEAALALGASSPKQANDEYYFPIPCPALPPGSPPVVVFRATLHTTPVKTGKAMEDITLLQTVDAEAINFGPYMADLQRRIKRAWFPPKGTESKKVVVIFRINKGGELSNLRLDHASGAASADQAALKAVKNASPFRTLPPGAADDVDIQFTFDYNTFSGGGSCSLLDSGNSDGASEPPAKKISEQIDSATLTHTTLYKSTDYQPVKAQPRNFSLKRLAKHVCLAPVTVPAHICSGLGSYPYGYDDSAYGYMPPPNIHSTNYYGYSFGMNSSPFGYNYVY